ncbi:nicotinate-nucleotide--dimethylbenzimidazole phosphoribosyltransferase [Porticoccaceae bacterium]|jgi:nicotinate-nucleotide--dimethylbenzimidazole phosphoribosyltransferase|nr:nicotinate-nucleotide--dimethylbenzimidazole phosphoribosyltransferase [Porticoccaceae bacterium]
MISWLRTPAVAPCAASRELALQRQQQLTKPPGSLGRLEQLAIDFAGFQKDPKPKLEHPVIRVFAADHGVVAEGISAFPQAVTGQMIYNFVGGGAAITVLAKQQDADFAVINLGTVEALAEMPKLVNIQIAGGTANFCQGPAMTLEQMTVALESGRDSCADQPVDCFVGGEMGIGNTTAAAAIFCALLGTDVDDIVGRGTGVDDAGLQRKREAVQRGLDLHTSGDNSPEDILRCLGGFEIAALVGAYIGHAQRGVPSLVDGYISTAAALLACRICPSVADWLLFSHCSAESAHALVLNAMQAQPLIDLEMRLGEGSGAGVALSLIQSSLLLHSQMATFAEAGVSES